mgnify:CR=1 FL=1
MRERALKAKLTSFSTEQPLGSDASLQTQVCSAANGPTLTWSAAAADVDGDEGDDEGGGDEGGNALRDDDDKGGAGRPITRSSIAWLSRAGSGYGWVPTLFSSPFPVWSTYSIGSLCSAPPLE